MNYCDRCGGPMDAAEEISLREQNETLWVCDSCINELFNEESEHLDERP